MTSLADRLAGLDPDAQGQAAREGAPGASTEELIEALARVELGEWAELHVLDELTHRGPGPVDAIASALMADPVARIGGLGEALVLLHQGEPSVRARVVGTLIDAADAALDAGGGSRGAWPAIMFLEDCARIDGPLPEAVPVARRLLAIAATEQAPWPPATLSAERLTGKRDD